MTKEYSEYLAHHGVKGMKWGQHIFEKKPNKKPESAGWKSSDVKNLGDEELNRRLSRLQRESQYKQLTQSNWSKAAKWIGRTASAILVASAIGASKGHMAKTYGTLLNKFGSVAVSKVVNAANKIKKSRMSTLTSLGLKG